MANFQKMTLIVAGILLLICIVVIVLIFLFPNTKQVWPPMVANCPDYFVDTNGDGSKCDNSLHLTGNGSCGTAAAGGITAPNFTIDDYNTTCQKYNWANGCGITWDGITYGVKNPCTNNSS
jgi:hypothetical protein